MLGVPLSFCWAFGCALNHVGQGRRGSRPGRLVHRTLQRVLQCAKRLLQSGLSVELRERRHAEFQLHVQHIKLIDSSGLQLRFDRLLLLSFGGEQRIARGQLFPRDSICRDRAARLLLGAGDSVRDASW